MSFSLSSAFSKGVSYPYQSAYIPARHVQNNYMSLSPGILGVGVIHHQAPPGSPALSALRLRALSLSSPKDETHDSTSAACRADTPVLIQDVRFRGSGLWIVLLAYSIVPSHHLITPCRQMRSPIQRFKRWGGMGAYHAIARHTCTVVVGLTMMVFAVFRLGAGCAVGAGAGVDS
ncbi:hypothetical protein QBC45DRAFT_203489 [Copromyces sp. CBS 386.78]|nr:hypothetical protein QBC45DRAFT_203489 [Copromyces sp. CBS 386.78]